jgi:hypothetical protein
MTTPIKSFDVSLEAQGGVGLPGFGTLDLVTSDNNQRHDTLSAPEGIVMHWTADTNRMRVYAAYHFVIVDNGHEAAVIRTLRPAEKGQHAWGRNTGLIGLAYAATADSSLPNYGPGAPTPRQRLAMQTLAAELCAWKHLDPRGTVSLPRKSSDSASIWTVPGTLVAPVLMSHQTLAMADGYSAERWDTGVLLAPDRLAAQAIYDELKGKPMADGSKRAFQFSSLL